MSDQPPASGQANPASAAPDGPNPTAESNRLEDGNLQSLHAQVAREKSEPTEVSRNLSMLMVVFMCLMFTWAGGYFMRFSGGFDEFYFDETLNPGIVVEPPPFDPLAAGKRFFTANCVACHQADGGGLPGVYPPLRNSDWVQQGPEEKLINIVLYGMQGEIVVNGNPYNQVMSWAGKGEQDRTIAAVLTYIRTSPEMENNVGAISEEMVAAVRAEYGDRGIWDAHELLARYPLGSERTLEIVEEPPVAEE